ncbi:ATP-dependent protease LonB [Clostridium grantii]|uniref:endopeptidase La n=1 Tax=Clostridium grantii DSM 8605 TaxID=1121316 RepID=A0A1M5WBB6_9CLOT|nr:ATP-dependent protease LonB [Clostridium grantii]SHH84792.1 Lon-like ATP-dependent protease [Clostridium grantii DSM 8605]
MTNSIFTFLNFVFTSIIALYFYNALKEQKSHKIVGTTDNNKKSKKLEELRKISLTEPLTEKSRPSKFDEVVGQENGIKALKAALCGPNPQHVIIYGPPGVGKTAAARLVLEHVKKLEISPFNEKSKFIEIDATTVRFDERNIADPLIGSIHDPIYQGAGHLGVAGVPQPKPGAVTKAHGGILFIDEIGELHPIETNKLLKVMEDRKVFFESAYYNSDDPNTPQYVKDIFEYGLPADFRLIGATTKSPNEICPAIRSRCIEVFFRSLNKMEVKIIGKNTINKIGYSVKEDALELISQYCTNGRDTVNLIQLAAGLALSEERKMIKVEDFKWVIENGHYSIRMDSKISSKPEIGLVNGLAVYGGDIGTMLEVEASSKKVLKGKGKLTITGIVESERVKNSNKSFMGKSTAKASVENVLTIMENIFNISTSEYNIHVNFSGGVPIDGPSAGITIATAIYSSIMKQPVKNDIAMTGEISLHGNVKPIGGVNEKIQAAKEAGVRIVIIPFGNWDSKFQKLEDITIVPVKKIEEVISLALIDKAISKENYSKSISTSSNTEVLTAKSR